MTFFFVKGDIRRVKLFFVGAIFTPGSEELQTAFNYAIAAHNTNDTQARFKVEPVVEALDGDDSYKIGLTCEFLLFSLFVPHTSAAYCLFLNLRCSSGLID